MARLVQLPATCPADEGEVRISLEMAVGTRLGVMDQATLAVENIVRENVPEMVTMVSRIGGGGYRASGGHTADISVALVSRRERKRSSEQIANDLRRALRELPGMTIRTRAGRGLFLLRMGTY